MCSDLCRLSVGGTERFCKLSGVSQLMPPDLRWGPRQSGHTSNAEYTLIKLREVKCFVLGQPVLGAQQMQLLPRGHALELGRGLPQPGSLQSRSCGCSLVTNQDFCCTPNPLNLINPQNLLLAMFSSSSFSSFKSTSE